MEAHTLMWKESGIEITIDGSSGYFKAKVGDIEIREKTLEDAREKVTKSAKSLATARKLSLPVVAILTPSRSYSDKSPRKPRAVVTATLVGVNRTTRALMFSDVQDGELDRVLPANAGNEALLKQWLAVQAQYDRINEQTHGIGQLGYGRVDAGEYDAVLDKVQEQYDSLKGGD